MEVENMTVPEDFIVKCDKCGRPIGGRPLDACRLGTCTQKRITIRRREKIDAWKECHKHKIHYAHILIVESFTTKELFPVCASCL